MREGATPPFLKGAAMIQFKVFTGTLAEIESAFNAWAAALMDGTNVQAAPLVAVGDGTYLKEVVYMLPKRSNGKIAVPSIVPPRELVN